LEEQLLDCWTRAAKDAQVIFDVGANSGIYSLAALASQPNAVVHAFEPTPEIATRLRRSDEEQWEVDIAPLPGRLRRKRGDELRYR
jgi:tRNA1(Val) A37 N6-methylase TrmN6